MMRMISEEIAREFISVEDANAAVEQTFSAMARGDARNYRILTDKPAGNNSNG